MVEAGYANECSPAQLAAAINANTAAILYIKSHHCVQKSILSVAEAAEVAKAHGIPLIVDAAAEEDLRLYYNQGADLVIYSGAKAIEGPTSGLVLGRRQYVEWVKQQAGGIGRAMKVGKEGILGLTHAIERYLAKEKESGAAMVAKMTPSSSASTSCPASPPRWCGDSAGRDIARTDIAFDHQQIGMTTVEVVSRLHRAPRHLLPRLQGQRGAHRDRRAQRHPAPAQGPDPLPPLPHLVQGEQLMSLTPNYYRDRVCLNVLAGSKENAVDIYEAAEGHVLVGVLSKNYPDIPRRRRHAGLRQAYRQRPLHRAGAVIRASPPWWRAGPPVAAPARQSGCSPGSGQPGAARSGLRPPLVNGLVSPPAPRHGEDLPLAPSSSSLDGIVPIDTAIALLMDMGRQLGKFFPWGSACRAEYQAAAEACARHGFGWSLPAASILENSRR